MSAQNSRHADVIVRGGPVYTLDPATPTVNEGDAPTEGTAADFAPFKGHLTLSRVKLSEDYANVVL